MARKATRGLARSRTAKLVEDFTRRWVLEAGRGLPPEFRAHMSASVREGLLAVATLWEETLREAKKRAEQVRRRVERTPVIGVAASRLRRPRKRRG